MGDSNETKHRTRNVSDRFRGTSLSASSSEHC